jgi:hypothetical protein
MWNGRVARAFARVFSQHRRYANTTLLKTAVQNNTIIAQQSHFGPSFIIRTWR